MNSKLYMKWLIKSFLFIFAVLFLSGCGADTKDSDSQTGDQTVSLIYISSEKQSVAPGSSEVLTITAKSANGESLGGVNIVLTLDNPALGVVTSNAVTGENGTASVTFKAGDVQGSVGVIAKSDTISSDPYTIEITNSSPPQSLVVAANPSAIITTKSSSISATIKDAQGNLVENGTSVTFSVSNTSLGGFDGNASSTVFTNAGVASTTFSSSGQTTGTVEISVQAGALIEKLYLEINPADASSIVFKEVSTNPVAIRESGGTEISTIVFDVLDVNGNPADDVAVTFTLSGPDGGEYIEEDDATPKEHVVSAVNGEAKVVFHSGYEPGTVEITASITTSNNNVIKSRTPVISIGGGVPTDDWLSLAVEKRNIAGWNYNNLTSNVTVYLADRYGNYNILDGHSVSFESEIGLAILSNSVSADKNGLATAQFRTNGSPEGDPCKDVSPLEWENDLKTYITDNYGKVQGMPLGHPRDGRATILAFTKGEESFDDGSNNYPVNGKYDLGESFRETPTDPFRDYDGDGLYDSGIAGDPFEDYIDSNNNGQWDGIQSPAVWDGSKFLFRNTEIILSGQPGIYYYIEYYDDVKKEYRRFEYELSSLNNQIVLGKDISVVDVENSTAEKTVYENRDFSGAVVKVMICDGNYNPMPEGSTYTFGIDEGAKLSNAGNDVGMPDYSIRNTMSGQLSVIEKTIVVTRGDIEAGEEKDCQLDIEVTWKSGHGGGDLIISQPIYAKIYASE